MCFYKLPTIKLNNLNNKLQSTLVSTRHLILRALVPAPILLYLTISCVGIIEKKSANKEIENGITIRTSSKIPPKNVKKMKK